jgi:hypothetical protein
VLVVPVNWVAINLLVMVQQALGAYTATKFHVEKT